MAAKSSSSRKRQASIPDRARTSSSPKPSSAASSETRFSGVSSTRRIFTLSWISCSFCMTVAVLIRLLSGGSAFRPNSSILHPRYCHVGNFVAAVDPHPQHREELLEIHWLGDVVRSPRFNAFSAIPFHGFGCQRDDWK